MPDSQTGGINEGRQSRIRLTSWVVGIHGRPYTPWNDVDGAGTGESGYCTHASILFPTWHRPYLALFEVFSPCAVKRTCDG